MAPTLTDRQILELLRQSLDLLVETQIKLTQALRASDSRRDSSDHALRSKVEAYTAEVQSAVMILLHEQGKREQSVTVKKTGRSDESGVQVTFGQGDETTRFQLSDAHWAKVRPWVLWLAITIAGALGLGKLFAAAAGHQ